MSPKWPILCRVGPKTTTLSISCYCCHIAEETGGVLWLSYDQNPPRAGVFPCWLLWTGISVISPGKCHIGVSFCFCYSFWLETCISQINADIFVDFCYVWVYVFLNILLNAFSALTLLVGRQEGHPACKKTEWWVLAWLSAWSEVQTCICPADATATHCLLLQ